jgi:hypothetical protein
MQQGRSENPATVLRIPTPAKGYYSEYTALQHKLSTLPHAQTALVCVYVRSLRLFLQPTALLLLFILKVVQGIKLPGRQQ